MAKFISKTQNIENVSIEFEVGGKLTREIRYKDGELMETTVYNENRNQVVEEALEKTV